MNIDKIMDLADDYASAVWEYKTSQTCDPATYRKQEDAQYELRQKLERAIEKYKDKHE